MTARVSTGGQTDLLIQQIFDQRKNIETVRNELASGIKVANPSDDPGNSGAILQFQNTALRVDRHKNRIATATGFLNQQETTLNTAQDVLNRAKELATEAANGAQSTSSRALIAKEVFQLRDEMVSLANTSYQGQFIYGGADYTNTPYSAGTAYTVPTTAPDNVHYVFNLNNNPGMLLTRNVQISDTDQVRLNTPADQVFANAISGLEKLGRALNGYSTNLTATVLSNGNTANLANGTGAAYTGAGAFAQQTGDILASMDQIDSANKNDITIERSDVGSRISRLEQVSSILDSLKTSTEENRSKLQDADPISTSAEFSNLQTALQALLASGAQINQLTLLTYL